MQISPIHYCGKMWMQGSHHKRMLATMGTNNTSNNTTIIQGRKLGLVIVALRTPSTWFYGPECWRALYRGTRVTTCVSIIITIIMAEELEVQANYEEFGDDYDEEGLCWYKCRWCVCLVCWSCRITRYDWFDCQFRITKLLGGHIHVALTRGDMLYCVLKFGCNILGSSCSNLIDHMQLEF